MALTAGSHHAATLTSDLDRLIGFYNRVFDAEVVLEWDEEGLRHAFIDLGGGFVLHPFQVPGLEVPQGELTMFERGRIDHFALRAETAEDFWELRDRIYREGASNGEVTDMGLLLSAGFQDPDGHWAEVCWDRPPAEVRGTGARSDWRYIPYPERT